MLKLFNTSSKTKEIFTPINDKRVTLYLCGPTVYNNAHIGNARPAVVFDVLYRILKYLYGDSHVIYARNITDIDDKIINKALQEGTDTQTIVKRYTDIYLNDMASLGVLVPTIQPRATDHIPDMIDMISRIIDNGHAYVSEGHVLFDVPSYPDHDVFYKGTDDVSRLETSSYKRDQRDFVLWKPSKENEPSWESPWGKGRCGWHIECSAMIEKNLGLPIDIHGGGIDLAFPHHENEISQGICSQGTCGHDHSYEYSKYWVHNEFVNMNGKMSKSDGNVVLVSDLLEKYDGEVIRLALLSAHHRSSLEWSDNLMQQSYNRLNGWYGILRRSYDIPLIDVTLPDDLMNTLLDDINMPVVLSILSEMSNNVIDSYTKSVFVKSAQFIGFLNNDPEQWFKGDIDENEVKHLINIRNNHRKNKDWVSADHIRKQLYEMGVVIMDNLDGTTWSKI